MSPATIQDLEPLVGLIISSLLSVAGIIFFVMLLSGGFTFLTSGGNPDSVAKAQKTIAHALFGLVAAVFSFMILVLIEYITGANVTNFKFSG
jgi:hypothetical protein